MHDTTRIHFRRPACCALLLGAVLVCPPLLAGAAAETADAAARYQQERAACTSGQSGQSQAACLKEADAAHAQALHGGLGDNGAAGDAANYTANASRRCAALQGTDRTACRARMEGQGTTSGSVAAGGIYRELVTVGVPPLPAPPATGATK
jgi:Flp pilus assembly protein TadG